MYMLVRVLVPNHANAHEGCATPWLKLDRSTHTHHSVAQARQKTYCTILSDLRHLKIWDGIPLDI